MFGILSGSQITLSLPFHYFVTRIRSGCNVLTWTESCSYVGEWLFTNFTRSGRAWGRFRYATFQSSTGFWFVGLFVPKLSLNTFIIISLIAQKRPADVTAGFNVFIIFNHSFHSFFFIRLLKRKFSRHLQQRSNSLSSLKIIIIIIVLFKFHIP